MLPRHAALAAATSLVLLTAAAASGQDYEFVNIADSTGSFGRPAGVNSNNPVFSPPNLNDFGQVAFQAQFDAGGFGVVRGDQAGVATVADSNGDLGFGSPGPSSNGSGFSGSGVVAINNAGTVAFSSFRDDGSLAIHTAAVGGPVAVVADNETNYPGVGTLGFVSYPQVNDNGTTTFAASNGIYRPSGLGQVTLVSGASPGFGGPRLPNTLNNADDVSFLRTLNPGTPDDPDAVFVADALSTGLGQQAGEATGGRFVTLEPTTDLNDAGAVLMQARLSVPGGGFFGETGLFASTAGSMTTTDVFISGGGIGLLNTGNFALGDDGTVAFLAATRAAGGQDRVGLYITDLSGAAPTLLLNSGNGLFGSELDGLDLRPGAVNANGEIAFSYRLANGTEGVAVAVVPEPAGLATLGVACAVLLRRRRAAR